MYETEFNCPLFQRLIDAEYCLEVQMVLNKVAKADSLEDEITDCVQAEELCAVCRFRRF